ncbi:FAD dependent oxidoreductase [Cystobasidium minutum MCA 4210]|uniref:FAD dependent oxidoreductase n=1 Tax=Cystobasidium minutum MCA 4210 TaxID=1397322 RepID=UPI0034CF418B|eukprot:jgi/Rhomi1/197513/gm1.5727_g
MTEVLIIGGGVFGLSTALSLARGEYRSKPEKILVIDRSADPPEEDAASSDINKIIRPDYSDPVYAALAQLAVDQWTDNPVWKPYFHQSGIVVASSGLNSHGEKYVRGSYSQNKNLQESRTVPSAPILLDTEQLFADAMAISPLGEKPCIAYHNKVSGWGWSTGAMKEMARQCRQAGVSFAAGQVNELIFEDGDVRGAKTKDGKVYRASKLVILAAGSWSPAIFPELAANLTATGQVLATIQLEPEEAQKYAKIPVYIDMESGFYSFPPNEEGIVKFAFHLRGWINEQPSLSDQTIQVSVPRTGHFQGHLGENVPREALQRLREQLRRVYPELADKPLSGSRMCWYCDSRDCDFLISYHDKYPSLFLATGGSGHAFKFLPTIGDLCVQAINQTLPEPLATMWSYTRQRPDYQPDRGTSVRVKLDPGTFATSEELVACSS